MDCGKIPPQAILNYIRSYTKRYPTETDNSAQLISTGIHTDPLPFHLFNLKYSKYFYIYISLIFLQYFRSIVARKEINWPIKPMLNYIVDIAIQFYFTQALFFNYLSNSLSGIGTCLSLSRIPRYSDDVCLPVIRSNQIILSMNTITLCTNTASRVKRRKGIII